MIDTVRVVRSHRRSGPTGTHRARRWSRWHGAPSAGRASGTRSGRSCNRCSRVATPSVSWRRAAARALSISSPDWPPKASAWSYPFVALQRDQLRGLIGRTRPDGRPVRTEQLNASIPIAEQRAAHAAVRSGGLDFLLLEPEQLTRQTTRELLAHTGRPCTLLAVT